MMKSYKLREAAAAAAVGGGTSTNDSKMVKKFGKVVSGFFFNANKEGSLVLA